MKTSTTRREASGAERARLLLGFGGDRAEAIESAARRRVSLVKAVIGISGSASDSPSKMRPKERSPYRVTATLQR